MPRALECGMPPYEFWYEDTRLFECYVKAYHDRINKTAWLNGRYELEAVSCAINNIMPSAIGRGLNGKQGKTLKYHDKPLEMFEKTKPATQTNKTRNGVAEWSKRIKQLKGMEA